MVQTGSLPKRYLVFKKDEDPQSETEEKNRAKSIELAKEKSQAFGDSIKEQFPVVEVVQATMFAPMIQIAGSKEEIEALVGNIESIFNCTLADADTPLELIQ